ncbi:hypothetical protein KVT40_009214 [Elsinoe batatas]|uniref:Uncharacterized protein n=1 Tax=Elsinoe batatas TaxID=2601811 RepID=A0A8K0KTJ0_9PEZI|nr:hypothetical protein KVT40_009214 [Elsinoe batatas]
MIGLVLLAQLLLFAKTAVLADLLRPSFRLRILTTAILCFMGACVSWPGQDMTLRHLILTSFMTASAAWASLEAGDLRARIFEQDIARLDRRSSRELRLIMRRATAIYTHLRDHDDMAASKMRGLADDFVQVYHSTQHMLTSCTRLIDSLEAQPTQPAQPAQPEQNQSLKCALDVREDAAELLEWSVQVQRSAMEMVAVVEEAQGGRKRRDARSRRPA